MMGSNVLARVRDVARAISPAGRLVAALGVLAWLAGWQLGWQEAMWIAAACAVVFLLGVGFLLGATDLDVTVDVDPLRVTVGEPAGGALFVRNTGKRRMLPLRVELTVGRGAATFDVPSLSADAVHDELFVLPTSRRQIIPVGPATSVRGDPLGLTRRAIDWTEPVDLYVHPRIARLDNLGAGFLRDLEGQPTADLSANDVAFHTLREYVPGDDRRFIHWRTTARVGDLMVRQFVDTRRSHLAIVLDTRPSSYLDESEFELAISLAGSLGTRALRDDQEVSLSVGSGPLPATNGQQLLDSLAGIDWSHRHEDLVSQSIRVTGTAGISIVTLLTGSALPLVDARRAIRRFDESVRGLVVRADRFGRNGLRPVGTATILNVADLEQFGYLMWKVTR
jgi:uncharacterized protein (DUF58 family)